MSDFLGQSHHQSGAQPPHRHDVTHQRHISGPGPQLPQGLSINANAFAVPPSNRRRNQDNFTPTVAAVVALSDDPWAKRRRRLGDPWEPDAD